MEFASIISAVLLARRAASLAVVLGKPAATATVVVLATNAVTASVVLLDKSAVMAPASTSAATQTTAGVVGMCAPLMRFALGEYAGAHLLTKLAVTLAVALAALIARPRPVAPSAITPAVIRVTAAAVVSSAFHLLPLAVPLLILRLPVQPVPPAVLVLRAVGVAVQQVPAAANLVMVLWVAVQIAVQTFVFEREESCVKENLL
jgi:hypothetical protein